MPCHSGNKKIGSAKLKSGKSGALADGCLLYTSDAADERSSVDLGGRRIIKKKNSGKIAGVDVSTN